MSALGANITFGSPTLVPAGDPNRVWTANEGTTPAAPVCTQQDDDACGNDPILGRCECGYVYHDIPRSTDDAHGELCGADQPFAQDMAEFAREQWVQGRDFSAMIQLARMARQAAVERARTDRDNSSLSVRAADYGLVPHSESRACPSCKRQVRTNMLSASVLRYRNSHRVLPNTIYGRTCWAEASYATRDL